MDIEEIEEVTNPDNIRKNYGSGPWDKEPDRKVWKYKKTGSLCLAFRNPSLGNWCGYVEVKSNNPFFNSSLAEEKLEVHGGVTFTGEFSNSNHPGLSSYLLKISWIGFDCAHSGDLVPSLLDFGDTYRTLDYVMKECHRLTDQVYAESTFLYI